MPFELRDKPRRTTVHTRYRTIIGFIKHSFLSKPTWFHVNLPTSRIQTFNPSYFSHSRAQKPPPISVKTRRPLIASVPLPSHKAPGAPQNLRLQREAVYACHPKMGWPVCNQTEEHEKSRLDHAGDIAGVLIADRKFSRRRPSMVRFDLSPFWPHSLCQFRLNRRAGILVPHMAAYNPLSQAVGAETVSLNSPPTLERILTTLQHHSRALHGSYLCHGLFPFLPILPTCRLF